MKAYSSLFLFLIFLSASALAQGSGVSTYGRPPTAVITGPNSGAQAAWPHPSHGRRLDALSNKENYRQRKANKTTRLDKVNKRSSGAVMSESTHDIIHKIIFYLPNRALDFWDIFRLDVGVGSSGGAVLRATRDGQLGYRYVRPSSYRLGARGRRFPFFIERSTEHGFGEDFQQSPNRHVTPYELGLGLDVIIVGAYAGVSFDEFWDFVTGWVLFDNKKDDL